MGKKEWTRVEVQELIYTYEQHPCLWNIYASEYKNKKAKADAYREMSEQFLTSEEEIKRKIHNLRNQFNSELKKMKSKKAGDEYYVSQWPYFENLLFIQSYLQARQTIVVFNEEGEEEVEEEVSSESWKTVKEEKIIIDPPKRKPEETRGQQSKKLKITDTREESLAKAQTRGSNDEYDNFGTFVADELKALRHDFLKRKLKRAIQRIVLAIAEEDDDLC